MTAAGFAGAVLCGGASTRMGTDKALLVLHGLPMGVRVARALRSAGAAEVVAVGGDAEALERLGLEVVPDACPGAGPLAGIVTALERAHAGERTAVLVAACDLVDPSPRAMAATVEALHPGCDVAVPLLDGVPQWVHAAWSTGALGALVAALDRGERAVHRAAADLSVVEVTGVEARALADADRPGQLPGVGRRPG